MIIIWIESTTINFNAVVFLFRYDNYCPAGQKANQHIKSKVGYNKFSLDWNL